MAKNGTGKGSLVQIILDKSGSMGTVQAATISGVNEFIQEHKAKVPEADFGLTLFDTRFDVRPTKAMSEAEELNLTTYAPSGSTALLDAVGSTIRAIEGTGDKYQRVVIVIMTDGFENASTQFTRSKIKDLVEWHQNEGKGWEFVFMGANIDSYAEAAMIGVRAASTVNYNPTSAGTQSAFNTVTQVTSGYSSGASSDASFTNAQRKKVESTK